MPDAALATLLRLELRRARAHVRKTALGTVLVVGGMFVLMGGGRDGTGMALGVLGMIHALLPAARSLTDKLDGSLEFLTSLPVEPRLLVRAHLIICVGWASVAAVPWAVVASLAASDVLGAGLGAVDAAGLFLIIATVVAALSALASGAAVRFAVETLSWLPIAVLLGAIGLGALVEKRWPDAGSGFPAWLATPQAPFVILALALALSAVGFALGALLLHSGYRHFRPTNAALPPQVRPFPS